MITDKNRLLRAIGDIDDKYITEILSEDAQGKQNVVKVPFNQRPVIRNMKYYLPAAAALLIVVACIKSGVFSGMGATSSGGNNAADASPQAAYSPTASADEAACEPMMECDSAMQTDGMISEAASNDKTDNGSVNYLGPDLSEAEVDMINPFTDCGSLAEAERIAGFEFDVPDDLEPDLEAVYRAMDGKLIEVIYFDRGEEIYRIRKGTARDVSGDYNEYSVSVCVDAATWAGELKGYKEGLTNCAVWTDEDGFGYSLTTGAAPIKTDRVCEIIDLLMQ